MLPTNVVQARDKAQQASQQAGVSGSEQYRVEDVLRQKVIDAYQSSQDIVKPLDVATQDYLGAPQAGREQYQNVFNPFQRENLVSKYVANKALPMLSLSSILGQRFGRIEDTIGAGTRGFQAQTAADQAKAEQARSIYQDLLNEYTTTEQLKGQESDRQLSREKFEFDKTQGSDGTMDLLQAMKLLGILNNGDQTATPNRLPIETALEEDETPTQPMVKKYFTPINTGFNYKGPMQSTPTKQSTGQKYFEPVTTFGGMTR